MMKKLLKIGIMYVFAMLLTCFVLIGCALDKTPPDDDGTDTAPEAFTVTLNKNELTLEEGKTEKNFLRPFCPNRQYRLYFR